LELTAQVGEAKAPLERLRLEVEFHLLEGVLGLLLADAEGVEGDAGVGEALLRRHHLGGERGHHFLLGEPLEPFQFAGVGGLELGVAPPITSQLGQGGVALVAGRVETTGVAGVEVAVLAFQLGEVAQLSLELTVQHRQVKHKQHLSAAHLIAHRHPYLSDLAGGAGVEQARHARKNQHALAHHLRGHGPEQGPEPQGGGHGRQGDSHLAVIVCGITGLRRSVLRRLRWVGGGLDGRGCVLVEAPHR